MFRFVGLILAVCVTSACGQATGDATPTGAPVAYAIAIHGGAGAIPRSMSAEDRQAREAGLGEALRAGVDVLEGGGSSLDAVEQALRILEDNPLFNAGRGAVFTADGRNELDASIMDGRDLSCGGVAGVTRSRHPISVARMVMERTPHVLLAGPGADLFAEESGAEIVAPDFFFTRPRHEELRRFLDARTESDAAKHGTVGAVALDRQGNLAAGTSTGGLTGKRHGRVGDSPIIGAGTYADNRACAVSATGKGEEFIRRTVARSICEGATGRDGSARAAAERLIREELRPGDGGVIVVDPQGRLSLVYNTLGMYRGAADATGRFEVKIWD